MKITIADRGVSVDGWHPVPCCVNICGNSPATVKVDGGLGLVFCRMHAIQLELI